MRLRRDEACGTTQHSLAMVKFKAVTLTRETEGTGKSMGPGGLPPSSTGPTVWPWASYTSSPGLSFPVLKNGTLNDISHIIWLCWGVN